MDLMDWVKYELVCIAGDGKPGLCTLPRPTNTLQDTGPGQGRESSRGGEGGSEEGWRRREEREDGRRRGERSGE